MRSLVRKKNYKSLYGLSGYTVCNFLAILLFLLIIAKSCFASENANNKAETAGDFSFSADFSLGLSENLTTGDNNYTLSNFTEDSYLNLLGQSDWDRHALAFSVDVSKAGSELTGDTDTITQDRTVSGDLYGRIDATERLSLIAAASQKETLINEDHPDSIYLDGEDSINQTKVLAFGTTWIGDELTFVSKFHQNTIIDASESTNTVLSKSDRDEVFFRLELGRKIPSGQISVLTGWREITYAPSFSDRNLNGTLLGVKLAVQSKNHSLKSYIYQNRSRYSNDIFGEKQFQGGYLNFNSSITDKFHVSSNVRKSFLERNMEPLLSTGIIEKSADISLSYDLLTNLKADLRFDRYATKLEGINGSDENETKSLEFVYDITSKASASGSISEISEKGEGWSSVTLSKKADLNLGFDLTDDLAAAGSISHEIETVDGSDNTTNTIDLTVTYQNGSDLSAGTSYSHMIKNYASETEEEITKEFQVDYDITDNFTLYGALSVIEEQTNWDTTSTYRNDVGFNYNLGLGIFLIGELSRENQNSASLGNYNDITASLRIEGTFE